MLEIKANTYPKEKGSFISILTGICWYYDIFVKLSSMKVDFKLMFCERKWRKKLKYPALNM